MPRFNLVDLLDQHACLIEFTDDRRVPSDGNRVELRQRIEQRNHARENCKRLDVALIPAPDMDRHGAIPALRMKRVPRSLRPTPDLHIPVSYTHLTLPTSDLV